MWFVVKNNNFRKLLQISDLKKINLHNLAFSTASETVFKITFLMFRVLVGRPEGKRPLRDLGVDGWIILGWISRRWDVGIWIGLGWPRIETVGGRL